jgi:GTP-binding protein
MQASWRPMVETYLQQRHTLQAVVHIVDLRHAPTPQDQQLRAWLRQHDITTVTVATKADQVTRGQRAAHIQVIRQELALPPDEPVLLFSAHNHEGRLPLWHCLGVFLTPIGHTQRVASP